MSFLKKIWRIYYWRQVELNHWFRTHWSSFKLRFLKLDDRENLVNLTIGITTFDQRYDTYFKKLLNELLKVFPNNNIVVSVNSSTNNNTEYLRRLFEDWSAEKRVHFIVNRRIQSLTVMWNQLLDFSDTDYVLLLNDDLSILPGLHYELGPLIKGQAPITLINASWSHFLFNKQLLETVGHFDQAYQGFGFEDFDYQMRLYYRQFPINIIRSFSIIHDCDQAQSSSYSKISDSVFSKYSKINYECFLSKWSISKESGDVYLKSIDSYGTKLSDQSLTFEYQKSHVIEEEINFSYID